METPTQAAAAVQGTRGASGAGLEGAGRGRVAHGRRRPHYRLGREMLTHR